MVGSVFHGILLLAALSAVCECGLIDRQGRRRIGRSSNWSAIANNERPLTVTLGNMSFFELLGNPCRGLGSNYNTTISFVNKTTEEVLSGTVQAIRDTARTVKWHLDRIARDVPSLTSCDHEDGLSYLNMLPELNRLALQETHAVNGSRTFSMSRRKLLYKAYLLLAATYKIMADDWQFGAHCTSDLTKENLLRRGFNLLSDGCQMMMCFMMADDPDNCRPTLSMKAEIYDAVEDVKMVKVRTCTSRVVRDCVVHKLAMQITNHIIWQ